MLKDVSLRERTVSETVCEVKERYKCLYGGFEWGAYYSPENYFVSYFFATDKELMEAKESGLTEEINNYHKEKLKGKGYPIESIKDCDFASQEECNRKYNGNWYYYYK